MGWPSILSVSWTIFYSTPKYVISKLLFCIISPQIGLSPFHKEFEFLHTVPRVIDKDFPTYDPAVEDDRESLSVPFNLEETYDQSFRANGFNGTWRSDTDILYTDNNAGDVLSFNVTSGISRILVDSSVTVRRIEASIPLISNASLETPLFFPLNRGPKKTFAKFRIRQDWKSWGGNAVSEVASVLRK